VEGGAPIETSWGMDHDSAKDNNCASIDGMAVESAGLRSVASRDGGGNTDGAPGPGAVAGNMGVVVESCAVDDPAAAGRWYPAHSTDGAGNQWRVGAVANEEPTVAS